MVSPDPQSYWIVLLDVEDYSLRSDTVQDTLHDELYDVVTFALRQARLEPADCPVQDRGDGMLILIPPQTAPSRLLRELVRALDDALAQHQAKYRDDHRMRLRLGVHQGLVIRKGQRWTGSAINDLARLVDAAPVKQALSLALSAHLVVVVSEQIHQSVVLGGYHGIDPAAYLPADFTTKHAEQRRGWVTVPGYPAPPGLLPPPPAAQRPAGTAVRGEREDGGAGSAGTRPADADPAPARSIHVEHGDYVERDKYVNINPTGRP